MSTRLRWVVLLCFLGCTGAPLGVQDTKDYGFIDTGGQKVWVRGPWNAIEPSRDIDGVIDQLCPVIMKLPNATLRDYGQEYCGVIYSLLEGIHYASMPSPLGDTELVGPTKRKSCYAPKLVKDVRGRAVPSADFHSHPWSPSAFSEKDRRGNNQWYTIRIQFDTACHIQKLIPHMGDDERPGEVYERRGKSWKLVGIIKPEDKGSGRVTAVDGD